MGIISDHSALVNSLELSCRNIRQTLNNNLSGAGDRVMKEVLRKLIRERERERYIQVVDLNKQPNPYLDVEDDLTALVRLQGDTNTVYSHSHTSYRSRYRRQIK